MDADPGSNAPQREISATVASCVIRVRELNPLVKFYCDVFSCNVAVRETDMALLVAPNGFHIYLHAPARHGPPNTTGVQYLLWAADSESDLQEFARRLRTYDPGVLSHTTETGVTVVEGLDPDGGRILIGYPSPFELPRTVIAARLHA
jgi:catechol-2,3-dioxygenase